MKVLVVSNMYPSPARPAYGVFVKNHVDRMQAEHGVCCSLAVSDTVPRGALGKASKYLRLYARAATRPRDFDLIHLHYPSPAHVPAVIAPRLLSRRPLVVTSHGGDLSMPAPQGASRWLVSRVLRSAEAVIAVSGDVKRMVLDVGVPAERVEVIDMGCDTELFGYAGTKAAAKADLGLDPHRLVLIGVGDLIPRKGFDVLLRALAGFPDLQVVIAGDGPERDGLRAIQHEAAVHPKWLGAVPQRQLARWYAAADLCVFPTRDEPLGLVSLEAMAAGAAVIASRVGGIPEIVRDGVNGLLAPVDDVPAFAAALRRLVADPALRERLVSAGRATADDHSLARQVRRVVDVYERVLAAA